MTRAPAAINLPAMSMDGYRYWVARHRLLVDLAEARARLAEKPDAERADAEVALDRAFRDKLDAIYGEARGEFETDKARN